MFSVSLRPFCIGFNVAFSLFVENLSRMRKWENSGEYCTSEDLQGHLRSVGGYHRMKEKSAKESWGIMSKCGAIKALDGPS